MPDNEIIDDDGFLDDTPPMDVESSAAICPECSREFKTETGLKRHITRMHGEAYAQTAPKAGRKPDLEREITEMFATVGLMLSFYNQYDGMVIVQNAERNAKAWSHLAKTNKSVDAAIRKMISATAYSEVFAAALATAIPIMANHGVLPKEVAGMMGAPPPDIPTGDV